MKIKQEHLFSCPVIQDYLIQPESWQGWARPILGTETALLQDKSGQVIR